MKNKSFKILLALIITFSLTAVPVFAESSFVDVKGHSQENLIEKWTDYGIIQGYSGTFRPDETLTASELDIMLDRLLGREVSVWTKSESLTHAAAVDEIQKYFTKYPDKAEGNSADKMTRAEVIAFFESLVGNVDNVYDHDYISKLTGGFSDTLEKNAAAVGWTVEEFNKVCELPAVSMSAIELEKITKIRDAQLKPVKDSLLQKVITEYDMNKYLDGSYKTPKGFISICNDVKQYVTTADCYYGLRLDYSGTYFKLDDPQYAVIRFTANNGNEATVPKSPAAGGTVTDPYPFGGAGFTTGTQGRLGSPEWVLNGFADIGDGGAQLLTIAKDGKEKVVGVYNEYADRFLNIKIEPNN